MGPEDFLPPTTLLALLKSMLICLNVMPIPGNGVTHTFAFGVCLGIGIVGALALPFPDPFSPIVFCVSLS